MEPKGECNLAVTQILHLHLYKTSSPVCFSGSLFLLPSFLSLTSSLCLFPFHVLWLGALSFSACFLYSMHSVCVCVNCGHPWGKGERWGGPVWEQPCQVLWYYSAWSYRHLVCLKDMRKVDLLFLFPSFCPSFAFYSTSLSFSHSLFSSSLEKTAAIQPAHRHPTLPTQPIPSIMVHSLLLLVWMQVS